MPKKSTTEKFITKVAELHNHKYDYSEVVYTRVLEKVVIICPKHGRFLQTAHDHLNGCGCPPCGKKLKAESKRLSNIEFVTRLNLLHNNNLPFELLGTCIHSKEHVLIKNKYGTYLTTPVSLLQGSLPIIKSATDKNKNIASRFFEKHGDKYFYGNFEYVNSKTKSIISCKIHGDFLQSAAEHLSGCGCPKCGSITTAAASSSRRTTQEDFTLRACKKHSDYYNYDKVIYTTAKTKIVVVCPIHGDFKITPNSHLGGVGCWACGRVKTEAANAINHKGWGLSDWITSAESSRYFDSFKVYFVKLFSKEEEFYKIGRTHCTVKKRFGGIPYKYESIYIACDHDAKTIFKLEKYLQRIFKEYKYTPSKAFDGKHECFKLNTQELVESVVREMQDYIASSNI